MDKDIVTMFNLKWTKVPSLSSALAKCLHYEPEYMESTGQARAVTLQIQIAPLRIKAAEESLVDLAFKRIHQLLCIIIHYKNTVKYMFGALKLIFVDSPFLLASPPDMCLYGKTYNYLWACITIRMYVGAELGLNGFVVCIYTDSSCLKDVLSHIFKHQSWEVLVLALIQILPLSLMFFIVRALRSSELHEQISNTSNTKNSEWLRNVLILYDSEWTVCFMYVS